MHDLVPNRPLPTDLGAEIDKAVAIILDPARISKPIPKLLYHYTDAAGLLGIVSSGKLRATNLAFLNDTREYLHAVGLLLDVVRMRKATPGASALRMTVLNELEAFLAPTQPENTPAIFVTCFTSDANSLNQWRSYGRGEGGYALGFETVVIDKTGPGGFLTPVIYDASVQQGMVTTLLDWALNAYEKLAASQPVYANQSERTLWWQWMLVKATQIAAVMKDSAFKEENEWRYVRWGLPADIQFHPRSTGLAPFIESTFGSARTKPDGTAAPHLMPIKELWSGPGRATGAALHAGRTLLEKFEYVGPHAVDLHKSTIPYRVA